VKIVVTAPHWHPEYPSGSSQLAWGHARYLAESNHEVFLLALSVAAGAPEFERRDGLTVLRYSLPPLAPFDPRRIRAHGRAIEPVLRRYLPDGADVVCGHTPLTLLPAATLMGPRAFVSYSIHSPVRDEYRTPARLAPALERLRLAVAGSLFSRLERRILVRCDSVTADSEFTRGRIMQIHGPTIGRRVQVVPGWVDEARFAPSEDRDALKATLGWPLDRPVLFTLRRLVPRMGLDLLLKACARLIRSGRPLFLALGGDGPLRADLERLAGELGISSAIRFVGRIPDDVLPRCYAAADAFVLPTLALECFGLIALEAMAAGRPALATPVGAIPEVVGRFEPHWLAREASVDGIAELLGRFLSDDLPKHDPFVLSGAVKREFGRSAVVPRLVLATMPAARGTDRECASD
jgi:glycosyltransferase involved in cell wall biosynthesis